MIDIIKYEGDNSTFVWKHPCEDFNNLTQLIVHESQEAIFFMNGQALDLFGAGRHTLETQNIPKLGKLINRNTNGETPFHCEVYFINKTVQMGIKWGTESKIRFIEPTMGIPLEIGACGEMNLEVVDSRKLLVKLVGTMKGIAWDDRSPNFTKSIHSSFRTLISTAVKSHLPEAIKSQNIDILEIDENLEKLSEVLRKCIIPGFEEYGLTIPQFYISNVLLPEDDNNFRRLRELHTISFQTKIIEAEAIVKTADADAKATIAAAERKAVLEREVTSTEITKHEAERNLIKAEAEARAKRMAGLTDAEIMAAKGYTQKDVLAADVQKAYAEGIGNMTINGGGLASDIIGLGVGMAAASAVTPQMGEMFKGANPTPLKEDKIKCEKCGATISKDAKFCNECGEKVNHNSVCCPNCKNVVLKGKFCPECGYKFICVCPKCGKEVDSNAKFCAECGEKL